MSQAYTGKLALPLTKKVVFRDEHGQPYDGVFYLRMNEVFPPPCWPVPIEIENNGSYLQLSLHAKSKQEYDSYGYDRYLQAARNYLKDTCVIDAGNPFHPKLYKNPMAPYAPKVNNDDDWKRPEDRKHQIAAPVRPDPIITCPHPELACNPQQLKKKQAQGQVGPAEFATKPFLPDEAYHVRDRDEPPSFFPTL